MRQQQEESESDASDYCFSYVDVQLLIASNIKERVLHLTDGGQKMPSEIVLDPEEQEGVLHLNGIPLASEDEDEFDDDGLAAVEIDGDVRREEVLIEEELLNDDTRNNNIRMDEVKPYLIEFANVVSCNWVLSLVEAEIALRAEASDHELIFLVNLLPNRINLFKNCLYLKQTPNLSSCNLNYFAVNLVKNDCTKKDMDVVGNTSSFDEINLNFLNYFRNVNKLIEIKIQPNRSKQLTIKLTRSKNAKKVCTADELLEVLRNQKSETLELDIREYATPGKLVRGHNLLFFVNNQIDINEGEVVLLVDPAEKNLDAIRHFARSVLKAKKACEPEEVKSVPPVLEQPVAGAAPTANVDEM